jgi:hypothetical protein
MDQPQGLAGIPMNLTPPPEDAGLRMPPKAPITSDYEVAAPESRLSGGEWERFGPGQFAYHPSPEDLAMPDLIEHFAEIEVVGNLLVISMDKIYEGGIAHDVDNDGQVDAPTRNGPSAPTPGPGGESDEDYDDDAEDTRSLDPSKLGVPPGNSWMDKPGPSILPLETKKHY